MESGALGAVIVAHMPGVPRLFEVMFCYDQEDPYAVRILFPDSNEWVFAREILHEAVLYQSKDQVGDVRARRDGDEVLLTFSNAETSAEVHFPTTAIAQFLHLTYEICPMGEEDVTSAIDDLIADIQERNA